MILSGVNQSAVHVLYTYLLQNSAVSESAKGRVGWVCRLCSASWTIGTVGESPDDLATTSLLQNDLPEAILHSDTFLFADDVTLILP